MRDSTDRLYHYQTGKWSTKEELVPWRAGSPIKVQLEDNGRVLVSPLHVWLGLKMQFTNFLGKYTNSSPYLHKALPGLTAKGKAFCK